MGVDKEIKELDLPAPPVFGTEETEKSILAGLISGDSKFEQVSKTLEAEDFYSETHKLLFQAIERVDRNGEEISELTICKELEGIERPGGDSWPSYITKLPLISLPLHLGNLDIHLIEIKNESKIRSFWIDLQNLATAIKNREKDKIPPLVEKVQNLEFSGVGQKNKLKPISARDLSDQPPPESLWAGLIYPGCITQLNAEPGAGKSTIAYNLAALGALGEPFLRILFSKPLRTLYVDLETPLWLRRAKIETICNELPESFHLLNELNLQRDLGDLRKLCKSERYDLLVFDTQSRIFSLENENDNAEANRVADSLGRLAREFNIAILLLHHTKKSNMSKSGVYGGRGASAIAGAVDTVANLEVLTEDTLKLKVEKSRIPGVYLSLTIKKIGGDKFECLDAEETNGGLEIHRIQGFILDLMKNGKEWRTGEIQVQAQLKAFKERTIGNALRRLREAGKIIQLKQGVYILAEETGRFRGEENDIGDIDIPEELY